MTKPATLLSEILIAADAILEESALNPQQHLFFQHIRNTAQELHQIAVEIPATDYALRSIVPALGDAFQAPQSVLFGYAKLLMENPSEFGGAILSEWQREQVNQIYESGVELAQWTDALHEERFAERKQQRDAAPISFNLNMLVWQHIPIYRYWVRQRDVQVTVHFPAGLPPVFANPYHVAEIIQHTVIVIALELIDRGKIQISARRIPDENMLELSFLCDGLTISPETLQILFQKDGRHVYRQRLDEQGGSIHVLPHHHPSHALHIRLPLAPKITH